MEKTTGNEFKRRDFLVDIEKAVQKDWEETKAYEVDAPEDYSTMTWEEKNDSKFFTTFPYPYMNGRLHLGKHIPTFQSIPIGHAFSLSKNEFQTRYQRLKGKRALFPFSFHCTGMPIAAAAKRLTREMEAAESGEEKKDDGVSQADILRSCAVEEEDIPKFRDAEYWLDYFPPHAKADLQRFGVGSDFRRSFITTPKNGYYDSFVRWQFNTLKKKEKLGFGKRPAVFAIGEDQPCADHDRSSGEGVGPQEYTLIKLKVLEFPETLTEFEGKEVFLVAATLRPETMYGQTNCFVLPEGKYGVFEMPNDEYFVCTERSMIHLAYQEQTKEVRKWNKVADVKGSELIGTPLKAPLAKYERVYTLPLLTISMKVGTGIVTSVPSDSPDDYAALKDYQEKAKMREQYGIQEEWVKDFDPVSMCSVPYEEQDYEMLAVHLYEKLKIKSQKDAKKLKEAKDISYKFGFNYGVMTVGEFAGTPIKEAKDMVKDQLISTNQAMQYYECENPVMSRTREECIVAKVDQWLIKYGEEEWKKTVEEHVKSDKFSTYNQHSQNQFEETLDWLKEWGISRTFGLGTQVPWDDQFVIESLSDSTIYMAYYTVAHLLQEGKFDGSDGNAMGIKPEDLTDEVWDYVFLQGDYNSECSVSEEKLAKLRNEFEYWYPMDLRCSGKDLIKNHLTFCLYNHAAIWEDKKYMPKAMFGNGWILLNHKQMSKSDGNFLTLRDTVDKYSADASRIAIADAGDLLDDANMEESVANAAILKLYTLGHWIEEHIAPLKDKDAAFFDEDQELLDTVYQSEMNRLVNDTDHCYKNMKFKLALRSCFYEFISLRDSYILMKNDKPHPRQVLNFIKNQLIILSPITPHFCEHYWKNHFYPVYSKIDSDISKSILTARWPQHEETNVYNQKVFCFLKDSPKHFRQLHEQVKSGGKKGKKGKGKKKEKQPEPVEGTPEYKNCIIFYAKEHKPHIQIALEIMQKCEVSDDFTIDKSYVLQIREHDDIDGKLKKHALQFASMTAKQVHDAQSLELLDTNTKIDEGELVRNFQSYIFRDMGLDSVEVYEAGEQFDFDEKLIQTARDSAQPSKPSAYFYDKA